VRRPAKERQLADQLARGQHADRVVLSADTPADLHPPRLNEERLPPRIIAFAEDGLAHADGAGREIGRAWNRPGFPGRRAHAGPVTSGA